MIQLMTALFLSLLLPSAVHAQKRVALVIGNAAYQSTSPLANPRNDATDMAAALKALGFQVIDGFDLDKASFDRKVRDFAGGLSGANAGVFFYAGHGLQVAGHNYLVPVDAKLTTAAALDWEMVRLDLIQRTMERETETNVLFLDSCRDNPLARNLARAMGTRSGEVGRGLAATEAGVGTLISFSTQPGNVALDGTGRNSPFAGALVRRIGTFSDDLSALLIDVRNDVRKATLNKQVPWEHSALTGRFYFNASAKRTPPGPETSALQGQPQASPAGQTRELFTEQHAQIVRALADKHGFTLPDFNIEVPSSSVPAELRRHVGVWVDETGGPGKAKKHMMIISRVDPDGTAAGYYLYGPPTSTSFDKGAAKVIELTGKIAGNTLQFKEPSGTVTLKHSLTVENRYNLVWSNSAGVTATRVLRPVWRLVEAERSAKQ